MFNFFTLFNCHCSSLFYRGREVQTKITKCETPLLSLRQIYISENIFKFHKTKLHNRNKFRFHKTKWHYWNKFTFQKTNLHFRKQIYISENKFTFQKTNLHFRKQINKTQNTNLQVPKQTGKGMYQLQDWTGSNNGSSQIKLLLIEFMVTKDGQRFSDILFFVWSVFRVFNWWRPGERTKCSGDISWIMLIK